MFMIRNTKSRHCDEQHKHWNIAIPGVPHTPAKPSFFLRVTSLLCTTRAGSYVKYKHT